MRSALRVLAVALAGFLWQSPAVFAQEEGVFVDPGSPTGKEYALPFDTARRQADPSAGGASAAPGAAPLFGAGIVSSRGTAGTSGQTEPESSGSEQQGKDDDAATQTEAPTTEEEEAALEAAIKSPGAPSGGLDAPAVVALLAAGLLFAGAVAGVVIRRTRG